MPVTQSVILSIFPLDGFAVSVLVLIGAIIALFAAMHRNLKKK